MTYAIVIGGIAALTWLIHRAVFHVNHSATRYEMDRLLEAYKSDERKLAETELWR